MSRVSNLLYGLIENRHFQLWKKIFTVPRAQMRMCLFITQNDNSFDRRKLRDELVRIGVSQNRASAKTTIKRAISKRVLVENGDNVSVANPTFFELRILRGSVLDSWRILTIPFAILTILFLDINLDLTRFFALIVFVLLIAWFVDDWLHTVKY